MYNYLMYSFYRAFLSDARKSKGVYMRIKISTDSTADIPKHFCEELNISVIPLTIIHEDREYRDGIDIQPEEFYKILDEAVKLPTTSQVPVVMYQELFESLYSDGYTDLIHVAINSKGSGTYQSGVLSRELFYENHPDAKGKFNIHIIDSKTYSMTYGIAVVEAAEMVKNGESCEKIIEHITDWVQHGRPMFVPLNLKCVKKSGRVSPAAAFVGDALGLKPMITFEDGDAKIVSKVRGDNKAVSTLVETCLKERKPAQIMFWFTAITTRCTVSLKPPALKRLISLRWPNTP